MLEGHTPSHRTKSSWQHMAGGYRHLALLLLALAGCQQVDRPTSFEEWPLHVAAESHCTKEAEKLIAAGIDVNDRDEQGRTPLHIAAGAGALRNVTLLLDHGADIDAQDRWLHTPLHKAAVAMHSEVVKVLLERGAQVNVRDLRHATPLGTAGEVVRLRWKAEDGVLDWIAGSAFLVQAGGDYGRAEAHYSHASPRRDPTEMIPPEPPLHKAALYLAIGDVERLVAEGARVDVRDAAGRTVLHRLALRGMSDRVEFFLSRGVDVNARDKIENTPLHIAAGEGYKDIVTILLAHGADVDAVNRYHVTPLTKLALGASRCAQEYAHENYGVGRVGDFVGTAGVLIANGSDVEKADKIVKMRRSWPGTESRECRRYEDVVSLIRAHLNGAGT